jgi:hypothetical protein
MTLQTLLLITVSLPRGAEAGVERLPLAVVEGVP